MRDINLTSARKLKADLDEKIDSLGEAQATSFTGSRRELTVQVPMETEMYILVYESLDKSKTSGFKSYQALLGPVCVRKQQYPNNPRPF